MMLYIKFKERFNVAFCLSKPTNPKLDRIFFFAEYFSAVHWLALQHKQQE